MFNIRTLQANYGDCFTIEFDGDNGETGFALIDGGPQGTYNRSLRNELERIAAGGGSLDFVAISHVDADHIRGVLDFFAELEAQAASGQPRLIDVSELWHNSFSKTIDTGGGNLQARFMAAMNNAAGAPAMLHSTAALQGIWQGNQLRIKALQLGIDINSAFPDDLIVTDTAPVIQKGNLTIRIVGPSRANLDQLRQEWEDWLDRNEPAIASGDPHALANSDDSTPNLSSLMFLVEADGKTALFTGDGRSDHLLGGLADAGLFDGGRLHVDVLKVSHHGSDRNATRSFFRQVTADTYIVSANGHPDNPDLSTLIWIVESAHEQDRRIRVIFTNDTSSIRKLRYEYPESDYGYELEIMPPQWWYRTVELA